MSRNHSQDLGLFWGDMHTQFKQQWTKVPLPKFIEDSFKYARDYLDFYAIAYYPAFVHEEKGLHVESVGWHDRFAPEWDMVCALVKKYHRPGQFVTFPGYEWTGDRRYWGDHNVFYPYDDPKLDLTMALPDLYDNLREAGGIAIPHHTAYSLHERGKDWDCYDEKLSPFAEILSSHGSSEGCDTPIGMNQNLSMGPRTSGGSIQDGLARGYRLGIIASGDNPAGFPGRHGWGLFGCYAEDLTRESLWEGFKARRVFGVTGDRMRLDFRINSGFMGDVVRTNGAARVNASVIGSQAIDRIELIKNNRVIETHCNNGSWTLPRSGNVRLKVQIEHGWGPAVQHGLTLGDRKWDATLKTSGVKIVSVEKRFTHGGQKIVSQSARECRYKLRTTQRQGGPAPGNMQSVIFEIEGKTDGHVTLECSGVTETWTLRELMERSHLIVLRKQTERVIRRRFGVKVGDCENVEDTIQHNSYKIKIHRAAPEKGYTAKLSFRDEKPGRGRSFYYIRASQLNGQYAWSSPIWVEPR